MVARAKGLLGEKAEETFQRLTVPRRRLLGAVAARNGHFTAEELCRELPDVSRTTVFRTLGSLVKSNILCRVVLEGGSLHYSLSPDHHHHHLVCVDCGRMQDITSCNVREFVTRIGHDEGYVVLGHRLEIYGKCPGCEASGS